MIIYHDHISVREYINEEIGWVTRCYPNKNSFQKFFAGSSDLMSVSSSTLDLVANALGTSIDNMQKKIFKDKKDKKKRTQWRTLPDFRSNIPTIDKPWIPFKVPPEAAAVRTELLLKEKTIVVPGLGKFLIHENLSKEHMILKITNGTLIKEANGWYLTVSYQEPVVKGRIIPAKKTTEDIGLDPGLDTTVVVSTADGKFTDKINLPNAEKEVKYQGRKFKGESDLRAFLQRKMDFKINYALKNGAENKREAIKGSKAIRKLKEQIARSYQREKGKVDIDLHTTAYKIVEMSPTIIIGDVSAKFLQKVGGKKYKNRPIGRLKNIVAKVGKAQGTEVLVIDEAKTTMSCSSCGADTGPKGASGLKIREWTCCKCGTSHDRDINAAKNIVKRYQENPSKAAPVIKEKKKGVVNKTVEA